MGGSVSAESPFLLVSCAPHLLETPLVGGSAWASRPFLKRVVENGSWKRELCDLDHSEVLTELWR